MPWILKYEEEFHSKEDAVRCEKELTKRKDRKYIEKLIALLQAGRQGSQHPG